ncbi:DUF1641 domain-containing protein [Metallosphaera tengchongensis]|uniref:DUF1641 domain-containing protein n=1 Tax=Metallosphaera tengchongensis TaxID=1532350 RepID=A0A6N0NTA2_9CREN|nr:DUF1641 domain-containing protein [Metallosphaera tengchongensis]QKQ99078.1 DUF1641 domain-containing protein [Metallosphaera tengchongensis]
MEEDGVQTLDRVISLLGEDSESLEQFLRFVRALHKSGVLQLMTGLLENFEGTLSTLSEENRGLIKTLGVLYSVLNGDEEVEDASLTQLIKELNDPDVRRGLRLVLKVLRAIGSASRQG